MAVNLSPVGGVAAQFFTNTGAVLTGGKLYTYAAGTTTPATTFTSSTGATPWTNPIVLDAAGRVSGSGEIWLTDGISYKFILRDSNDVLIATYDNITGINSNSILFTNQQQIITATANQTVFNLSISYQPGTNSLSVFVDGVNQYGPGAQYAYTETSPTSVTFTNGLHVGAVVKFTTSQQQGAGVTNASQITYIPAGTGAVATNVQTKLRQTVSVQDFGAVGDGVADDTAAIVAAESYAFTNKFLLNFGNGRYKITSGITLRCAFRFDKASYADLFADANDRPGFIPTGLSSTTFAVTVQTQLGQVENLSVLGNTSSRVACRGVLFDNVQRCEVTLVTVTGLNGCGIEVRKCWDSTFIGLSTLKCGNVTDYAVQITDGTGSTNECVFNHIQTEQAQVKGIYVSPNTYNCTFNVIHSEQVAGDGTNYTHDIRGNVGCVWNSTRLTGTQVLVRLGSAGGVYNSIRVEDDAATSACQVNIEYAATGYTTTMIGGEIQGNLTLVFGNSVDVVVSNMILGGASNTTGNGSTGLLTLLSCVGYVGSLGLNNGRMTLENCVWSTLTTSGGNGQVFKAYNTSFSGNYTQANDTNLIADRCTFSGTFSTGGGGSSFDVTNSTFVGNTTIGGNTTSWRSNNCQFNANISAGGGTPTWCFSAHDRVGGTVTGLNTTPSGSTGLKQGDTTWRLTPASGQPAFWRWTGAAWLAGPNL